MTNDEIKMLLMSRLEKKATSPVSDTMGRLVGNSIIGNLPVLDKIVPTASTIGSIGGLIVDTDESDVKELNTDTSAALSMIPGVNDYNMSRRRRELAKRLGENKGLAKPISEMLGSGGSVLRMLLGAGIGAAVTGGSELAKMDRADIKTNIKQLIMNPKILKGMAAGFGIAAIPETIGALTAAITDRRTKDEQSKYEKSNAMNIANILVPGLSTYNQYKNIGYMQGEYEKHKENAKDA